MSIVKSEETYTLTAKADDFEDYVISNYTFTPGEPKIQNITMRKIEHPSVMTGTVTCDGEPVDGAIVKLTATDDSKLVYKATTGAEGTYVINVVKSDKTYTLKVTCGGCEDYTEENITFTPDKDMTNPSGSTGNQRKAALRHAWQALFSFLHHGRKTRMGIAIMHVSITSTALLLPSAHLMLKQQ